MSRILPDNGAPAAEQMKAAALRLFAEHGVDAVSVRQIAEAAGQKNHAVVGYYFGSKEDLVRAVIVHGAKLIDELRNRMFDEMEARGGPSSVVEVTACLVRSSLPPAPAPWSECYNRFVVVVALSNRRRFMVAMEGRWNSGYLRGLDHIRRLLPDLPAVVLSQRLVFMGAAIGGVLAARESELADRSRPHPTWSDEATLDHFARSLAAMVMSGY
jgi:AcrR family transcriptional regulator